MNKSDSQKIIISRPVLIWLIIGLFMVFFQIIIGGITRLTGSGLSITEWDIITGTLPPFNIDQWNIEFEKYKLTPQYEKLNIGMEMGTIFSPDTFKFIYFWEYLHRLWARTMGFVFLFPFMIFYFKKLIPKTLLKHFGFVIGLAVVAAAFGWIMVASGLINRPWVNAYKLAIHLCMGIAVFIALWWAFINYAYPDRIYTRESRPKYLFYLLIFLCIQIFLGGVMSGTKAALFLNTWPDYNGNFIPNIIFETKNWTFNNFSNYEESGFLVSLIQLLHRSVAYVIFIFSALLLLRKKINAAVSRSFFFFFLLLVFQVILGVITLINSTGAIPVFWGVMHQAFGVLTLAAFFAHIYFVLYRPVGITSS